MRLDPLNRISLALASLWPTVLCLVSAWAMLARAAKCWLVEYRDSFQELNVRSNKVMREIANLLLQEERAGVILFLVCFSRTQHATEQP